MSNFPLGNDAGWGPWLLRGIAVWIAGGAGVAGHSVSRVSSSPGAARPGARGSAGRFGLGSASRGVLGTQLSAHSVTNPRAYC